MVDFWVVGLCANVSEGHCICIFRTEVVRSGISLAPLYGA
jgi:hypothetical protein